MDTRVRISLGSPPIAPALAYAGAGVFNAPPFGSGGYSDQCEPTQLSSTFGRAELHTAQVGRLAARADSSFSTTLSGRLWVLEIVA